MTDPDLVVDDLTFADLLRMALSAAPAASRGRWTVHGPVDPGVTLLELFAWQLEQRLYMAERVTGPVIRAGLRLLAAREPAPARAAVTVLCFRPGPVPDTVPAGTAMTLERDGRAFTLDEPVTVLPIGPIAVGGDPVELSFVHQGPPLAGRPVSLLFDVAAAPGVAPQWSPSAADVPPAANLRWTALGPDDTETSVAVDDGTGGLRRSGLVRFAWPAGWDRLGARPCRLRARPIGGSFTLTAADIVRGAGASGGGPTFADPVTARGADAGGGGLTEPVTVRGVYANAVLATHREPRRLDVTAEVGRFLPLPGQRLRLTGTAGLLLDDLTLDLTEPDGDSHPWTAVPDWTWAGPEDRVFVVDRARGEITFGDGLAGRIPRAAGPAVLTYALGGGTTGNVGRGGQWVRGGSDGQGVSDGGAELADNPLPAEGGAEPEDLAAAEQAAASALAAAGRTVTADDAELLALATPGVGLQRALAGPGMHPGFRCVEVTTALSVTVVPYADRDTPPRLWTRAPLPDEGALAAVRAHLSAARLIDQEIFVLPPAYRAVSVAVTLSQSARSGTMADRVSDVLTRFLDPLRGGTDRQGWPFGGVIRPSALTGVIGAALGPEAEVVSLSVALDDQTPTSCADLPIGPRELVYLAALRIDATAAVPSGGGLR